MPIRFDNALLLLTATVCFWLGAASNVHAWQSSGKPSAAVKQSSKAKDTGQSAVPISVEPWEKFVPDIANTDLAGSESRAWEYRPYKVACWFCLDGSPRVNAVYPQAAQEIADRSELLDPSGWTLAIGQAPSKFRSQFLKFLRTPDRCVGFAEHEALNEYDKLMVVCLSDQASQIKATVREFDVQTQQWGPINHETIPFGRSAGQQLMNAIASSFMPIAQIERVTAIEVDVDGKKQKRDEVLMQLRAVRSCYATEFTEVVVLEEPVGDGSESEQDTDDVQVTPEANTKEADSNYRQFRTTVVPASNSPAFIRKSDLFLPVIRRTDRSGKLIGLEPLEFTFLTVDEQQDAVVRASIQSTGRNPLGQRKSKKAKKLALVIRPPQNSTTLQLLSREKQPIPMEGFTIKEVPIGAPRTVTGIPIGRSDYQGKFDVTPSESGMRVLVISRGGRNLMKLPIVPGLYDSVEAKLPNDEVRLYSQGVFKGFQTELLGLIVQREVVRERLNGALGKKLAVESRQYLDEFQDLDDMKRFRERFNSAVSELKTQTSDKRELKFIESRLDSLNGLVNKRIEQEGKIHFDNETKKYNKGYLEQVLDLEAEAKRNKS